MSKSIVEVNTLAQSDKSVLLASQSVDAARNAMAGVFKFAAGVAEADGSLVGVISALGFINAKPKAALQMRSLAYMQESSEGLEFINTGTEAKPSYKVFIKQVTVKDEKGKKSKVNADWKFDPKNVARWDTKATPKKDKDYSEFDGQEFLTNAIEAAKKKAVTECLAAGMKPAAIAKLEGLDISVTKVEKMKDSIQKAAAKAKATAAANRKRRYKK